MLEKAKEVLGIINGSARGAEGRIVGGAVRNSLIDTAISDVDIATNLTPAEVTAAFEAKKIRVIPTGIDFGTVTVVYQLTNFEITTLRKDIDPDGRHTKVLYTKNWQEDAARRDFTFNAMYMDVNGDIYDFFDGHADLKQGLVRFIGNAEDRIKEDYLRILRMFRFYAWYGKADILGEQLAACAALKDGLKNISGERVRVEMLKLLTAPDKNMAAKALKMIKETGVLQVISGIEDKFWQVDKIEGLGKDANPIVALAAILSSELLDEQIEALAEKWRLSNKESRFLERLREALELDFSDDYKVRKSCRINGKDEFYDYAVLNFAKGRIDKNTCEKFIKFAADFAVPEFPVKSSDLINRGITPGKKLGDLLRKAEELWEQSAYKMDKDELLSDILIEK